eukprot:TRINITY_DN17099_c0_g1_i2.p1 TRINITY_DN17099_c0_g1~~TRINITY_DN17099_c0_g1_i2.p1  ORF type:complete len:314 (-),score=70.45 TRINITY_DN17099_c0_g1_i2:70-1011(-)
MGCCGSKDANPFVAACRAGDCAEVKAHAPQSAGESRIDGLVSAVDSNHLAVVKILVQECGAQLVQRNSMKSALGYHNAVTMAAASQVANDHMLSYLLTDAGGNSNARDPISKKSALHFASAPNLQTVKVSLLSQHGADVNAVDKEGNTPLDSVIISHKSFDQAALDRVVEQFRYALGAKLGPTAMRSPPRATQEQAPAGSVDHALVKLDGVMNSVSTAAESPNCTAIQLQINYTGTEPRMLLLQAEPTQTVRELQLLVAGEIGWRANAAELVLKWSGRELELSETRGDLGLWADASIEAVAYTHLTLPTKRIV